MGAGGLTHSKPVYLGMIAKQTTAVVRQLVLW